MAKKNPLLLIGTGIVQGLPLLRSLKELIKPTKIDTTVHIDGKPVDANVEIPRPDWREILIEIVIVALIAAFVFGKITLQDLQVAVGLVK